MLNIYPKNGEAIRKREISCTEVLDAILERIEKINPKINAFCTVSTEEAHQAAKEADEAARQEKHLGPLHGVPVSIEDLIFSKGIRTTFGSMRTQFDQTSVASQKRIEKERVLRGISPCFEKKAIYT